MTTVISRVYADQATADKVLGVLKETGFPEAQISVITAGGNDIVDGMVAARVDAADATIYAEILKSKEILVVVRALITPFGAARRAIEIMDGETAVTAPGVPGERYIEDKPDPAVYRHLSIFTNHPFMALSKPLGPDSHRAYSAMSHDRLITPHRRKTSVMEGTFFMSPGPHIFHKKTRDNIHKGGKRFFYNPKNLSS